MEGESPSASKAEVERRGGRGCGAALSRASPEGMAQAEAASHQWSRHGGGARRQFLLRGLYRRDFLRRVEQFFHHLPSPCRHYGGGDEGIVGKVELEVPQTEGCASQSAKLLAQVVGLGGAGWWCRPFMDNGNNISPLSAGQDESLTFLGERHVEGKGSLGGGLCQHIVEGFVVIAPELSASLQQHLRRLIPFGAGVEEEAVALDTIDSKAVEMPLAVEEAEAVAIVEGNVPISNEAVGEDLDHLSHGLADTLRCASKDVRSLRLPSRLLMEKIMSEAAIETLVYIGLKGKMHLSAAGSPETATAFSDKMVEGLRIGSGDVLDIGHVLEPALYLEGPRSGFDEFAEGVYVAEILEGEQVLLAKESGAISRLQVKGQATNLCAFTAVGTASAEHLAGVAPTAETDAESTMDEDFEPCLRAGLVDVGDVGEGEFAGQYDLFIALTAEGKHLLGRAVVHLRGGMQAQTISLRPQAADNGCHGGVLHDKSINASFIEFTDEALGNGQFLLAEQGVDGGIDADTEGVGEAHKAVDVLSGVAGCRAGTEAGGTDIYGIGTVADGLDADVCRSCGGKQFNCLCQCR